MAARLILMSPPPRSFTFSQLPAAPLLRHNCPPLIRSRSPSLSKSAQAACVVLRIPRSPASAGDVGEVPVAVVTIEHGGIVRVNRCQEKVQIPVIVVVAECRRAVGYLIVQTALAHVLEPMPVFRTIVLEKTRLRLTVLCKVAGEQIEEAVVVEIAPC